MMRHVLIHYRVIYANQVNVTFEPPRGKTKVVFEQARHKPSCKSSEKCYMLEILDISRREIVLSV